MLSNRRSSVNLRKDEINKILNRFVSWGIDYLLKGENLKGEAPKEQENKPVDRAYECPYTTLACSLAMIAFIISEYSSDSHGTRNGCSCLKQKYKDIKADQPKQGQCGKCSEVKDRAKLMVCQGCKVMNYCSKKCQRADWANHKQYCRTIAEMSGYENNQV